MLLKFVVRLYLFFAQHMCSIKNLLKFLQHIHIHIPILIIIITHTVFKFRTFILINYKVLLVPVIV
jgi:hypothetical protein